MVTVQLSVGVDHRSDLLVLEVVFESVSWGLVCSAWGASVGFILTDNLELHQSLSVLHPAEPSFCRCKKVLTC